MTHAKKILSAVAAAGMILATAPVTLWAESAAPNNDVANLFPGGTAAYFDPNAAGTKYSGTLTIAYEALTPGPPGPPIECGGAPIFIEEMFVVLTLQRGNQRVPFTTHAPGLCLGSEEQAMVIIDLIEDHVIPSFYNNCTPPACPSFKVKSLTNFQYTSGAQSMDITIAVR